MHVWGCLTFVLDPRLQDGKKLPKCSPRSHLGCFLRYSTCHSSTVSLILNLKTGSVTPQYHLVHNYWFSTVTNASSSILPESLWNIIISSGYEREVYEISEAHDTWHDYDVSTWREESRKELNTLNHEEDLSSDEDSQILASEGANITIPEGENNELSEGARQTRNTTIPEGENNALSEGARQTRTRGQTQDTLDRNGLP